ncbi:MAG TPA: hypothetical protein DEF34_07775 [Desulfotomaculum sp.]|nr:MAG: hypothetical protein JL56_03905 [Desulfotomaculum sp. BICA1-6]HBX23511.1 hypothetical protein [Desulfotomaculum sp.]
MKIYIHAGMGKTGSSAIQAFLTLNYEMLKKKGYLFPNPPNLHNGLGFQTSGGNAHFLYELFKKNKTQNIKEIIKSFMSYNINVILSSEMLFHVLRIYPERFFDVFNKYDYKIIIYVRRQDNLLSSCYNQFVKYEDMKSDFIPPHGEQAHDFCMTLKQILDYSEIKKIIVRPYEKKQFYLGNIFADFLNCIGLELHNEFVLPEKIVNPSLDSNTLEFRRILNILEVDKDNLDAKYIINNKLAKYTVENNMGRPFQDNNIFSIKERLEIINKYAKENEDIARVFLNREDGKLFCDPLPKEDKTHKTHEKLTFEKAVDICKYILKKKYQDNIESTLIEIVAKGTLEKVLSHSSLEESDFEKFPVIYKMNKNPTNMSKDIGKIKQKGDFWLIEADGTDPYFTLPAFNKSNNGRIIVKIGINAPTKTVLQLFYISNNTGFHKDYCVSRNLIKGYNQLIFEIKEKAPIKSLRLDPGSTEGIYILNEFEVRG